jgi:capsular polysaccharide export protein
MSLGAAFFVRNDFPWLNRYFDLPELQSILSPNIGGTVSWGGRISAKIAEGVSQIRRLPHWHLEDGFLRSAGLGKAGSVPLSIIVDDLGLPVDARHVSRLEKLIGEASEDGHQSGSAIRDAIVRNKLSKYNHLPHKAPSIQPTSRRRLLLVDQVVGDVSVPRALGSAISFDQMLNDAAASNCQCVVRTHPDVIAGYRKGYLSEAAVLRSGFTLLADPVSVSSLLDVVDEVWTVSSQFGFDALLRGLPVRCYAAPFYAGWHLTDDRMSDTGKAAISGRRHKIRTIEQLAAIAFSLYPSYRDPSTWRQIDVFRAIELILAHQRSAFN